ncbi:MAG: glycosyltransferase [Carbonactinosporaceae bacterium]
MKATLATYPAAAAREAQVTVDAAGAVMGGATRFLVELGRYLGRVDGHRVRVIGEGRRISPRWLARRELVTASERRVALNNMSFVSPGGERWVLLRNALHFLTEAEAREVGGAVERRTRAIGVLVRAAAGRADVVVVPCSAMADRVAAVLPGVRNRIVVRHHPVSPDAMPANDAPDHAVLCPVVFGGYKAIPMRLRELLAAAEQGGYSDVEIRVTAACDELPGDLSGHPQVVALGRLPHAELMSWWSRSAAVFFPTRVDSFGYPLAEARVYGRPVIAQDTAQAREIARSALCGYQAGEPHTLVAALESSLKEQVIPDPAPFEPGSYFRWLLDGEP